MGRTVSVVLLLVESFNHILGVKREIFIIGRAYL